MPEFQSHPPINAGIPFNFPCGAEGRYACLDCLGERNGIYIFQHENEGVLYVGVSYGSERNLKIRISQHYTPGNSGGDFRKNYCRKNCRNTKGCEADKKSCKDETEPSFMAYRQLVQSSRIRAFSVAISNDERVKDKIQTVEYKLICHLNPKYNAEIRRERRVGTAYVRENVCEIMRCL